MEIHEVALTGRSAANAGAAMNAATAVAAKIVLLNTRSPQPKMIKH